MTSTPSTYAKWKQGVSFPAKYESKKPCKKCGQKIQAGEMMRLGTSWGVYEHAGSCPIQGASVPPTVAPVAPTVAPSAIAQHGQMFKWASVRKANILSELAAMKVKSEALKDEYDALSEVL